MCVQMLFGDVVEYIHTLYTATQVQVGTALAKRASAARVVGQ